MQARSFLQRLLTFTRREDGNAAIEAAIIFPVGFLLVMGTMEMALYFFANSALNNAVKHMAYEAAQECKADEKSISSGTIICDQGAMKIKNAADRAENMKKTLAIYSGNLIKLDPEKLCVRVQGVVPAGSMNNLGTSGQIMRYDFSYRWHFFTPLIGNFFNNKTQISQFNASFLVRNGEIGAGADRNFTWMNQCSGFNTAGN